MLVIIISNIFYFLDLYEYLLPQIYPRYAKARQIFLPRKCQEYSQGPRNNALLACFGHTLSLSLRTPASLAHVPGENCGCQRPRTRFLSSLQKHFPVRLTCEHSLMCRCLHWCVSIALRSWLPCRGEPVAHARLRRFAAHWAKKRWVQAL